MMVMSNGDDNEDGNNKQLILTVINNCTAL